MRDFLAKELPASSFEPRELASPSAGLTYKMLQVPPSFDVTNKTDGSSFTTRSRIDAYTVPSRSTKPNTRRLRLGLLPSRDPELPRTANIIRPANHEIWGCATGAEVREFLRSEFPQLPDAVVSDEASRRFRHRGARRVSQSAVRRDGGRHGRRRRASWSATRSTPFRIWGRASTRRWRT